MFYRVRWKYDGGIHTSREYHGETLSEIYEQAKSVYQAQDNCPTWVIIYDDTEEVFASLPL